MPHTDDQHILQPGKAEVIAHAGGTMAGVIRDVYFAAGSVAPQYRLSIRPVEMDDSIDATATILPSALAGADLRTYLHGGALNAKLSAPLYSPLADVRRQG